MKKFKIPPCQNHSLSPMVRVLATASLLRTFQPHPGNALCCDYSGLRPIYATQSHPKMLTLAHIQSLSGAKLRSGSESPNARSFYYLETCCSTKFFDEPSFCNGRYSTRFAYPSAQSRAARSFIARQFCRKRCEAAGSRFMAGEAIAGVSGNAERITRRPAAISRLSSAEGS